MRSAAARRAVAAPEPAAVAAEIDAQLAAEAYGGDPAAPASTASEPAAVVDDVTFLRRVSLDLVGELPPPERVIAFASIRRPTSAAPKSTGSWPTNNTGTTGPGIGAT